MAETVSFTRSHDILIAARPEDVYDYLANPHSWPEWLASSHEIDCPDRPLAAGERFHERWSTRRGEVHLDWLVLESERPRRWRAETATPFTGPIVAQYDFVVEGEGTRYTRTLINPARPKAPTAEMIARIDADAEAGLANIRRIVEERAKRRA